MFRKPPVIAEINLTLDSTAVTIFVVILVELTNTVFVNSTNITLQILRRQCCLVYFGYGVPLPMFSKRYTLQGEWRKCLTNLLD